MTSVNWLIRLTNRCYVIVCWWHPITVSPLSLCYIPRTTSTPLRKRTCLVRYGNQLYKIRLFTCWYAAELFLIAYFWFSIFKMTAVRHLGFYISTIFVKKIKFEPISMSSCKIWLRSDDPRPSERLPRLERTYCVLSIFKMVAASTTLDLVWCYSGPAATCVWWC